MAQAGAKNKDKVDEALQAVTAIVENMIKWYSIINYYLKRGVV
jgi:hypothetical protein